MPLSNEVIENLHPFNENGSRRIMATFLEKTGKKELGTKLGKIRETGSTGQRHESGRPKHARTEENGVTTVNELVGLLSQEDHTHPLGCQIPRETV